MQVEMKVNADGSTENVIVTSKEELTSIIQSIIIYNLVGQINLHIKETGIVKLSVPTVTSS